MLNYIKNHLELQRKILAARRSISIYTPLTVVVGEVDGRNVYLENDVILAFTGATSDKPNAVVAGNHIIVNQAASELPECLFNALVQHELGHIIHKHVVKNPVLYQLQAYFGFGEGLKIEYEADEYSLKKGGDILGLLMEFQRRVDDTRALRLRIQRVKMLMETGYGRPV